MSPHVTPCHPMSPHVTPCYPMSPHVTPCHPMSPHVTPCNPMSPHVTPCHPMSPHVTPCHPMSPHVTPCHPMSPHVTPCHPTSPHVTPCHPMSPHVTPCHPMLPHVTTCHPWSPHVATCHPSQAIMIYDLALVCRTALALLTFPHHGQKKCLTPAMGYLNRMFWHHLNTQGRSSTTVQKNPNVNHSYCTLCNWILEGDETMMWLNYCHETVKFQTNNWLMIWHFIIAHPGTIWHDQERLTQLHNHSTGAWWIPSFPDRYLGGCSHAYICYIIINMITLFSDVFCIQYSQAFL